MLVVDSFACFSIVPVVFSLLISKCDLLRCCALPLPLVALLPCYLQLCFCFLLLPPFVRLFPRCSQLCCCCSLLLPPVVLLSIGSLTSIAFNRATASLSQCLQLCCCLAASKCAAALCCCLGECLELCCCSLLLLWLPVLPLYVDICLSPIASAAAVSSNSTTWCVASAATCTSPSGADWGPVSQFCRHAGQWRQIQTSKSLSAQTPHCLHY